MLARTVLGALAVAAVGAGAMKMSPAELRERQRAAVKRMQDERALSPAVKRAVPQNITFSDPRASGKSPFAERLENMDWQAMLTPRQSTTSTAPPFRKLTSTSAPAGRDCCL